MCQFMSLTLNCSLFKLKKIAFGYILVFFYSILDRIIKPSRKVAFSFRFLTALCFNIFYDKSPKSHRKLG